MKTTILIILSFFFVEGCAQDSKIDEDSLEIEYIAYSRGGFHSIVVNNNFIKEKSHRDQEDFVSRACPKGDWKKIMNYLAETDWDTLKNLEAPTKKRLFDGAMHASLKITYKDKTYQSSSFDHGAPPKEIKSIVDHVLSLAESIE